MEWVCAGAVSFVRFGNLKCHCVARRRTNPGWLCTARQQTKRVPVVYEAPAGDPTASLSKRYLCSTTPENKVQSPRSLLGCPINVFGIACICGPLPITFDSSLTDAPFSDLTGKPATARSARLKSG